MNRDSSCGQPPPGRPPLDPVLPSHPQTSEAFQESLAEFGVTLTDDQAECGSAAYAESGQPLFFALGIGVAGGGNENASTGGVLAHNNPNTSVLSNGLGIDHFDDSGIIPALEAAAVTCGIPV